MGVGTAGCIMVTGVLFGNLNASMEGIIASILSGLFISMFFIGNRMSIDRDIYPATMLFYTTLFADLIALPFIDFGRTFQAVSDPTGIAAALALGIMMTLIPYYLLTWSSLHLEPTVISMISVLEVAAAAVVGYIVFGEDLDIPHIIGIALVIASIILINVRIRMQYLKRYGKYISPLFKLARFSERYGIKYIIPFRIDRNDEEDGPKN